MVYQTVGYMDRFYAQSHLLPETLQECCLTSYVALFIASKNSEVEPLSLRDIRDHFLRESYKRPEIVARESAVRQCIQYENEVSYLFDFVMLFMKIWKLAVQEALPPRQCYLSTYKFICDVETAVYDFSKSLLIDAESLKYRQSLLVAALISASIEISLKQKFEEKQASLKKPSDTFVKDSIGNLPLLPHLRICNQVWETFVIKLFGKGSLAHVDAFGHYLVLR